METCIPVQGVVTKS